MIKYLLISVILISCKRDFALLESHAPKSKMFATTVNVKDFGAKADGITDNVEAFQNAEDYVASKGGGTVYVTAGTYIVSAPFYHRSFVTLMGDGDKSIIRNKVTAAGPGQFCIYVGNFSPSTYAECPHYDAGSIAAGSYSLTVNGTSFFVGQIVLIDSKSGFMSEDGHWKPYAAFINRIRSVSRNTITLEDPASIDIADAQIAPTNQFNDTNKIYICQQPVIKNIRFESLGDWSMRFGVYKGWFENISLRTTDVIPGNGFSYCVFKNIRAEFSQKVIETAMYSHNSTVDGLTATWWTGATDPDQKPLIKMGENVRDCSFSNVNINTGTTKVNFSNVIRFEHAFNNKIFNCVFTCKNVKGSGVAHEGNGPDNIVTGNQTYNNTFYLGSTDSYMEFKTSNGALINGNAVTKNTFYGKVKKDVKGDTANNIVVNNIFNH